MPSNPVELDITLLRTNPEDFMFRCQRIIKICVRQHIASGMFKKNDEEDMIQMINVALLEKLPSIESQYNGFARMQTYINAVIQNICLKIHRESQKTIHVIPLENVTPLMIDDPINDIIIHQELDRLHAILQLGRGNKNRILFFVKLYLGIQMKNNEFDNIIRKISLKDKEYFAETILRKNNTSILYRFEALATLMNKYRKRDKVITATLLRWASRRVHTLIKLLNGNPPTRTYTEESLKVLLEEYSIREYGK